MVRFWTKSRTAVRICTPDYKFGVWDFY